MPRRLAQQRMTLSELEWPFHASRAISAVAELLVLFCRQILHNGSLYINDTQQDDSGLYTCILDNGVGQQRMTAALDVVTGQYFCC